LEISNVLFAEVQIVKKKAEFGLETQKECLHHRNVKLDKEGNFLSLTSALTQQRNSIIPWNDKRKQERRPEN
jgi:hypothetical protein